MILLSFGGNYPKPRIFLEWEKSLIFGESAGAFARAQLAQAMTGKQAEELIKALNLKDEVIKIGREYPNRFNNVK
jgi:hypothetical protein